MEKGKRRSWFVPADVPPSVVSPWVCYIALLCYIPTVALVSNLQPRLEWGIAIMAAVPTVVMLSLDVVFFKVRGEGGREGARMRHEHTSTAPAVARVRACWRQTHTQHTHWLSFQQRQAHAVRVRKAGRHGCTP